MLIIKKEKENTWNMFISFVCVYRDSPIKINMIK